MHRSRQSGRPGTHRRRRADVGRSQTGEQALRRRSGAGSGGPRALGGPRIRMTSLQSRSAGLIVLVTGSDRRVELGLDGGRRLLLEFEDLGPTDDTA